MDGLNRLPAELRIRIWELCFPEPRHILVSSRRQRLQTPLVFHICHESREEARRHYTPARTVPEAVVDRGGPSPIVWADLTKDTVCVEDDSYIGASGCHGATYLVAHAESLAFQFNAPQNFMQLYQLLEPINRHLHTLKDLKEVVLYSPPKKWFDDHTGRVQERVPPLTDAHDAAEILLRLLHMLFGGHAWLDSGAGIPPPLRWNFVCNEQQNVWAGPFPSADSHEYVFRCAATGRFEIQRLTWAQLGSLRRVSSHEPRVHQLVGCYEGCPQHADGVMT